MDSFTKHLEKQRYLETEREKTLQLFPAQMHALREGLRFSYAAYGKPKMVKAYLKGHGFKSFKPLSTWFGAEGFCCLKERQAYIAFCGTDSLSDILVDLLGILPWFKPLVHSGFGLSWHRLKRKGLQSWLKENADNIDSVGLYGHSLGGAIAHVGAYDLANDLTIREVITFGAPRSYVGAASEQYDNCKVNKDDKRLREITFRVVNGADLVSRVPFAWMGYRHIGQLIYIDSDGLVHFEDRATQVANSEKLSRKLLAWMKILQFDSDAYSFTGYTPRLPSENQPSIGTRLKIGIGKFFNAFPIVQHLVYAVLFLCILPFAFIGMGIYLSQASISHLKTEYCQSFITLDVIEALANPPRHKLIQLLGSCVKFLLILTVVALFLFGFYWIVINITWPGLVSIYKDLST